MRGRPRAAAERALNVPLYVHALADAPVMPWQEQDGHRIESLVVGDIVAIVESREAVPPLTELELQRQHNIVLRIAAGAPAVIPARFGSLLDEVELSAILRARKDMIRSALDHVRDHVQMTLRMAAVKAPAAIGLPTSGRDYLLRRRGELLPAPLAAAEPTLGELRPFVRDERRKPGERDTLTIYHLIRRADVKNYRQVIAGMKATDITMSGPFAPFAFAPDLLA